VSGKNPLSWNRGSIMSERQEPFALEPGQRWSTWNETEGTYSRGPQPYPDWLVVEGSVVDIDLGLVKPGKEARLSGG